MNTTAAVLMLVLVGLSVARDARARARRIAAMGDFYKSRAVPKTNGDLACRAAAGTQAPRYPMAPEDVLA